jgi:hypothetical protein
VLVLAICYAQFGYHLRFEAQRKAVQRGIKERIRKGLPKDMLTAFRMTEAEWAALHWEKPGREFRLPDGRMYDVIEVTHVRGMVEAWCIHDREETHLFAGLREHVRRLLEGDDPEQGPAAQVQRLIAGMLPPAPGRGTHVPGGIPIVRADGAVCGCSDGYLTLWSPPPEV